MCFCPKGVSGICTRTLANKTLSLPIFPVMLPGSDCTKDYEYILIITDIIFEAGVDVHPPLTLLSTCVQRQQLLENNQREETSREVGAML